MKDVTIHLRDALKLIDESVLPDGSHNPFTIEFFKYNKARPDDNGVRVQLANIVKCGLPYNVKNNMKRGLMDLNTKEIRSCSIWLISRFNNLTVKW